VIDHLIQLFTPAAAGTMQHRASNQTGLPDFGPLLEGGTAIEAARVGDRGDEDASSPGAGIAPQSQHQLPDRTPQIPGSMSVTGLANTSSEAERTVAGAIGERRELVSMRWGLRANAGLSYLTSRTEAQAAAPDAMLEDLTLPLPESSTRGQLFTFAAVDEGASAGDWLQSLQLLEVASMPEISSAENAPILRANSAIATSASSTSWPERLLRWLATPDGKGATAWIRDFQMTPSQAARMIDSLRSLAAQQGQQLHRIVLNGHELWRSVSKQPNDNRGQ